MSRDQTHEGVGTAGSSQAEKDTNAVNVCRSVWMAYVSQHWREAVGSTASPAVVGRRNAGLGSAQGRPS